MDVYDLTAKLTLDTSEYEKGLGDSEKKSQSFGDKLKGGLGKAGKIVGGAFAATGAAIGAAAVGVGKFASESIKSYADFEQLIGGVETLFGDSAQKVIDDASAAFKTAGMDANAYMETSIQSAAALINSLGGDQAKAADLMNMSITDMADNVNKMGTSMESVQDAYRGFSRGNFTMLDNLALGFAGTKEGMQSLLDKAEEISGYKYDISSYSDIVEAIHVVQDEMGITGTTSKEAASTISGSLGMLKGSWQNLITGMADSKADIGKLIGDVVESAETVLGNLLPAVENALGGIGKLVESLAPIIANKLPSLVKTVLPSFLNAATSLVIGVVQALPSIISVLVEQAPVIIQSLVQAIIETLPVLIETGRELIQNFTSGMDPEELITKGGELLNSFVEKILEYAPQVFQKGLDLIASLASGVANNLPTILSTIAGVIGNVLSSIMDRLPEFLAQGVSFIGQMAAGVLRNLPAILGSIASVIASTIANIGAKAPQFLQKGIELIGKMAAGLIRAIPQVIAAIPQIIQSIKSPFDGFDWAGIGKNLITGIGRGIAGAASSLAQAALGAIKGAWDTMTGFLKISSPSKLAEEVIGKNWALGIGIGFEKYMPSMDMVGTVKGTFDDMTGTGGSAGGFMPVINVYGAAGQNIEDLADIVMDRMVTLYNRKRGAYA